MTIAEIKEQVDKEKVIAIVRGVSTEKCLKVADALYEGSALQPQRSFFR